MDYIGSILKILAAGLTLWSHKDANKYKEMMLSFKVTIDEEKRKPIYIFGMDKKGDYRDDNVIDHAERQLMLIGQSFSDAVTGKK